MVPSSDTKRMSRSASDSCALACGRWEDQHVLSAPSHQEVCPAHVLAHAAHLHALEAGISGKLGNHGPGYGSRVLLGHARSRCRPAAVLRLDCTLEASRGRTSYVAKPNKVASSPDEQEGEDATASRGYGGRTTLSSYVDVLHGAGISPLVVHSPQPQQCTHHKQHSSDGVRRAVHLGSTLYHVISTTTCFATVLRALAPSSEGHMRNAV